MKTRYNKVDDLKVILNGIGAIGRSIGIENEYIMKELGISEPTFYKITKVKDFNSLKLNDLGRLLELYGYELELVINKKDNKEKS